MGVGLTCFLYLAEKRTVGCFIFIFTFLASKNDGTSPQKLDPKRQLIKNEHLQRLSFFYTQQQFFRLLQECPQHTSLTTLVSD